MVTYVQIRQESPKPLGWWVVAILTPLGILGGPIALADLFAGVIEWRGPFPFLLEYWDEHISEGFCAVFSFIATAFHLPKPSETLVDYLTLSLLLTASLARAETLINRAGGLHAQSIPPWDFADEAEEREVEADRADDPARQAVLFHRTLVKGLFWPVGLVVVAISLVESLRKIRQPPLHSYFDGPSHPLLRRAAARQFLGMAPFLLFVLLFVANFFFD